MMDVFAVRVLDGIKRSVGGKEREGSVYVYVQV